MGIIGKTGSGKSTILELITRSYDVTSGNIYLDSQLLSSYDLKSLKSFISYVPQNSFLFSDESTIINSLKKNEFFDKYEIVETVLLSICYYYINFW